MAARGVPVTRGQETMFGGRGTGADEWKRARATRKQKIMAGVRGTGAAAARRLFAVTLRPGSPLGGGRKGGRCESSRTHIC